MSYRSLAAAVALGSCLAAPAAAEPAAWAALAAPGTHALMRHATAPGTGDPPGFRPGVCSTQRNLDEAGRAEARRIGAAIRSRGIAVEGVLTSSWCRAEETARLLDLGPVAREPALDSFFGDRSRGPAATAALAARIAGLGTRKTVFVTHQVNITALTGVFPRSGEIVVVSAGPDGTVEVRARIAPDEAVPASATE